MQPWLDGLSLSQAVIMESHEKLIGGNVREEIPVTGKVLPYCWVHPRHHMYKYAH